LYPAFQIPVSTEVAAMYDKEEATPLLPVVSSPPPPSITKTISFTPSSKENKMNNQPLANTATPPATPGISTWAQVLKWLTSPPRWAEPRTGTRTDEDQFTMDHHDQMNEQANKQTLLALIFLLVIFFHCAPLTKTIINSHYAVHPNAAASVSRAKWMWFRRIMLMALSGVLQQHGLPKRHYRRDQGEGVQRHVGCY
jgi:hypothetical protein